MSPPPSHDRCTWLLERWRPQLRLSARERSMLGPELAALDGQLERLRQRRLRVAVFGRVGVGKSSLLNALLGRGRFATDVAHGCTRRQDHEAWDQTIPGLACIELVDTPGIDEIAAAARQRLAARVALGADLVLFVLDGDLTTPEVAALEQLLQGGTPLLLVVNRIDCWPAEELPQLMASIRRRLPTAAAHLVPVPVAAAPRRAALREDGRVRSESEPARIEPLRNQLSELLTASGPLLLALNSLRAADRFSQSLHRWRLRHGREAARGLIGRFAALKATSVAANPLALLDVAGGLALDTTLVVQLCRLYGLNLDGPQARRMLGRISAQSALLGGAQLGIQLLLGGLRQVLLLAVPLSGGLSLAPAAPVAIAQAALAVAATRRTGRLAASELLRSAQVGAARPGALLRRLARQDPEVRRWLQTWQSQPTDLPLQALLP
ncbi:MAG: GTP-binding protein [Synechococcaceae cyanobacterium ELA445]